MSRSFYRALIFIIMLIGLLTACSLPTPGCRVRQLRKVHTDHLGQLTGTFHNPVQGS